MNIETLQCRRSKSFSQESRLFIALTGMMDKDSGTSYGSGIPVQCHQLYTFRSHCFIFLELRSSCLTLSGCSLPKVLCATY